LLDGGAVFGLEGADGFQDAGADPSLELFRLMGFTPVGGPPVHGAGAGGLLAVVIGDGVAENAVEPGHGAFGGAQLGAALDGFEVCGLKDILGGGRIADTGAQELQETVVPSGEAGGGVAGC